MEKCLDLALRKGKAGGEPKPTENKHFWKAVGRHYQVPDKRKIIKARIMLA